MASQKGAIRYTGKFANTVGFKNTASVKKNNFFIREHVDEVANPRTAKQAVQRAKARPAQLFYQAFEGILNHAYIPLGRASRNRNRFLSLAMKLQGVPDVPKGASFLPTLPYQISEGSLGLDSITLAGEGAHAVDLVPANELVLFHGLFYGSGDTTVIDSETDLTISEISESFLGANSLLENGEELTILAVMANKTDMTQRVSSYMSFVINTNDTVTTGADVASSLFSLVADEANNICVAAADSDWVILSAGLIISSKAGNSWRYTNSRMGQSTYAKNNPAYTEAEVLQSYMDEGKDVTSDKILQQADNTSSSSEVTISRVENAAFTTTIGGTLNHSTCAVAIMSNGTRKVVIGQSWEAQDAIWYKAGTGNYEGISATSAGDPPTVTDITLSNTNLAGSPTISKAEVIAAGF